ncbi:cupin domain-containing protein [Mesorhizobium sp. 1B3]|uniref:cupin domain-containing protein n=1 Tax=Mesorhizobium sp. 1B3 TaxID=3243599 RepID=UPI003D9919B0
MTIETRRGTVPLHAAETDARVGERVRELRKARGLTLQEVAERSGLSLGFVSQIERGKSSPSVRVLARLADSLQVLIGDLFEPAARSDANRIVAKQSDFQTMSLAETGVEKILLTPLGPDETLDLYLMRLSVGASSGEENYTHEGVECGYVLEGTLDLYVDDVKYVVLKGESFRFSSQRPHRFSNDGTRKAVVLWINSRPPER